MKLKYPLTKKQKETFDFLERFQNTKGFMPTIREVCDKFRLVSTSAGFSRLKGLEKKNWIRRNIQARSIKIIK